MKVIKYIVLFILLFTLIWTISCCFGAGITYIEDNNKADNAAYTLKNKYTYSEEYGFAIDDAELLNDANTIIVNSYSKMPKHLVNVIQSDWTILVAQDEPYPCNDKISAAGITYPQSRVIWVCTAFNEKVFVHECGHAIDDYLGTVSLSTEFREIYLQYWETYLEYDNERVDKHSSSSTSEFFAATFADYILHPDYLKSNYPKISDYFEKVLKNDMSFSGTGKFIHYLYRIQYSTIQVFNDISSQIHISNYDSVIADVNSNIVNNKTLNLDEYTAIYDIDWMSDDTRLVAQTVLDIAKNPEDYANENHSGSQGYLIEFDYPWGIDMYTEILSFTSMYFGDERLDPVDVNVVNGKETKVVIKHDVVLQGEANRLQSLEKVESVLSTIKSGTTTEIAVQVSQYIVENSTYKIEKSSTFNSFWENKTGDCVMYAMMFKQFMDRLGIENDIIHVVQSSGEAHVYNRILVDGKYRYYDLTANILDSDIIYKSGYHINTWQVS